LEEIGEKYPLITAREMKFIGLPIGENLSCPSSYLEKYKRYFSDNNEQFSKMSNEHLGLLHNLIIRYKTELSIFPYLPVRTQGLKQGYTFVDIGAFRGYVSLKAAKILSGSGKVYCVEPISNNNKLIHIQKRLNKLDNLVILNKAVSLKDEDEIKFYRSFNQVNSEIPNHVTNKKTTEIEVENISVKKLCDLIIKDKPKGIHMSITTNGTEIEITKKIITLLTETDIDQIKIVVPILYTDDLFKKHASFFSDKNYSLKRDYPWGIITKINS